MKEVWKDIPGFEGLYQASNLGRIKSLARDNVVPNRYGVMVNIYKRERVLCPSVTPVGYKRIILSKCAKLKTYSVYRLVMMAFKENPTNLPQINHIDGIKINNRIDNLEWCTQSHNQQHAYYTGLNVPAKGAMDTQSKGVLMITANGEIKEYGSIGEAFKLTGIKREIISKCCRNNVPIKKGKGLGYKFNFL